MTLEEMEQRVAQAVAPYDMTAMIIFGHVIRFRDKEGFIAGHVWPDGFIRCVRFPEIQDAIKTALERE